MNSIIKLLAENTNIHVPEKDQDIIKTKQTSTILIEEIASTDLPSTFDTLDSFLDEIYEELRPPLHLFDPSSVLDTSLKLSSQTEKHYVWKSKIELILEKLYERLKLESALTIVTQTRLIICVVPYLKSYAWTNYSICQLAEKIFDEQFPFPKQSVNLSLTRSLLENEIKSYFDPQPQKNELFFNYSSEKKVAANFLNSDWKAGDIRLYCVFLWLLEQELDFSPICSFIVPPILILVNDTLPGFKIVGLDLINQVLTRLPRPRLNETGLVTLFSEAVFNCLLYTQEYNDTYLADQALGCLLNISQFLKSNDQNSYYDFINNRVIKGVFHRGEVKREGDMFKSKKWLLEKYPQLIDLAGIYVVLHLQKFVEKACDGLNLPSFKEADVQIELPILSCKALDCLFMTVPSRIEKYAPEVLASLARCWGYIHNKTSKDVLTLEGRLLETIVALHGLCQDSLVVDSLDALARVDPHGYNALQERFQHTLSN